MFSLADVIKTQAHFCRIQNFRKTLRRKEFPSCKVVSLHFLRDLVSKFGHIRFRNMYKTQPPPSHNKVYSMHCMALKTLALDFLVIGARHCSVAYI